VIEDREGREEKIILNDIINRYLEKFSSPEFSQLSPKDKAKIQKEFVQELTSSISKIPHNSWSINFEKVIKTQKINCSGASSLLGLILESTKEVSGLKNIELATPIEHVMNIVPFIDGTFYYVDSRSNVFEDLSQNSEIEYREGLKIYKIRELTGGIPYKIVPVLPPKDGIIASCVGNLCAAYIVTEKEIPESLKKEYSLTPEQLKDVEEQIKKLPRRGAKEIYQEYSLDEEKCLRLLKIRKIFAEVLDNYMKTEEYREEVRRWREYLKRGEGRE